MIILNMEFDALTGDVIMQLLPIFIIVVMAYGTIVVLFILLSRPRTISYEAFNSHRRSHRLSNWIHALSCLIPKTRSNKPYRAYKYTSASQANVDTVGCDIDRYCNPSPNSDIDRVNTRINRIIDEYYSRRPYGSGWDKFK